MHDDELRAGDLVEVKSAREILATLDDRGSLEGLPFMPEMLAQLGRRLVVRARAERICDTIHYLGSMRMQRAVVLGDLRCDGSGHDGCEAECVLFWKEAWLRKAAAGAPEAVAAAEDPYRAELAGRVAAGSWARAPREGEPACYCCQATELVRASERVRLADPRPYLRVLQSGSVPLGRFLRVLGRAAVVEALNKLGRVPAVHLAGPQAAPIPSPPLGLRAGDWVEVRSREEIRQTLSPKGRNRGLWFDREMLAFCGRRFRVRRRVSRIVDERDGRMIHLKSDCIMLEGVVCSGENSLSRWFCPRAIYSYWRESWLKPVEAPPEAGSGR